MKSRPSLALAVTALVIAVATACTPGASPSPSPTAAFSSEAEAFAAAEATYRAYVDALNEVDLSDPATFEPVFSWTTGDANAAIRKSLSDFHARGLTMDGESLVIAFDASEADVGNGSVTAVACVDVSRVGLTDLQGNSAVGADRPDIQTVQVRSIASARSTTGLLVSDLSGYAGPSPC